MMSKMSDIPEHPIDHPSWEDGVTAPSCSTVACETRELKPCPFCDESIDLLRTQVGELESTAKDWAVQCCKCGAVGPPDDSARRAGVYWNTRKRNWVKCSERMPEGNDEERTYLLTVVNPRGRRRFVPGCFYNGWACPRMPYETVTHWLDEALELPEE